MTRIYKILGADEWARAEAAGRFDGSAVDLADGYIHFSTAAQAAETARRHFAGRTDLVLLTVHAEALGGKVAWEPSRGGALFPHLYAPLPLTAVAEARPLTLGPDGAHEMDDLDESDDAA